jgi:heme/copper-type cytochrome/quinol oxidase subunit 3
MSASAPIGPGDRAADELQAVGPNVRIGARLFASAVVFVFAAFVFGYFYLRAVNSNNDFRPAHVSPPTGLGVAILVCVIGTTAALELARRSLAQDQRSGWRLGSGVALGFGVAVVALQVIEYFALDFKTAAGGYASLFWGWTLLFALVWLGAVYWLETLVAQTARGAADGSELLGAGADGLMVYLYTLAGIEIVAFLLLYVVK